MGSGDSGDSPSNAAMGGGGGGNCQEAIACRDGFPVQFGNGKGVWGSDGQEIFLFIKYAHLESPLLEPHISSKAYAEYWVLHSTLGSLLVYKIFLENPPSGASYFFNNNNVLDGGRKIMQENPHLEPHVFSMTLM